MLSGSLQLTSWSHGHGAAIAMHVVAVAWIEKRRCALCMPVSVHGVMLKLKPTVISRRGARQSVMYNMVITSVTVRL